MRTLHSTLLATLGATVTQPGYLVQIDFSTPVRLSTLGDLSFNGYTWTAADIKVRGLGVDEKGGQGGSLVFANTLDDVGALVLGEGIADRRVRVWACDAGAATHSVAIFDGVGDDASIAENGAVTITLAASAMATSHWPRRRINRATGFTTLMPAGARLTVGGQPYILERA